MHNPTSVLENEMYKCHWDFKIQTDHLISAISEKKKKKKRERTYQIVDFVVPTDHRVKIKES